MNIENEKTIESGIEESLPSVEKSLSIESVDITQKEAMNIEKESDTVVFNQETSQRNPLSQDDETESDYELENENTSEYELESDNDIESEMMIENENEKVVSERHRILNERGKKKEKEVGNEKELVNEKEKVVHESEKEKENEVLLENETNGMNHQDEIRMNDNERNMVRENERDDIRMNDNERNMTRENDRDDIRMNDNERNMIRENDRDDIRMNDNERNMTRENDRDDIRMNDNERNMIRENDRESIRMNDNTSVYGKDMEMGNSCQPFIDFTSMNRPDNTFTQFLDFLKEDKKRESDSQMQILMNLLKMVSDSRAYDARFSLIENKIESLQQKIDKLMDLLQQQNTNNANN